MTTRFRIGGQELDFDAVASLEPYFESRMPACGVRPARIPAVRVLYRHGGTDVIVSDDVRMLLECWREYQQHTPRAA